MDLYTRNAFDCSKRTTLNYSTSFSNGIRLFNKKYRDSIYAVYGFVRFADEIVDTFHDKDRRVLLEDFKKETYEAISNKISLNPILHSFQNVVNEYAIEKELIEPFFESMEMDLDKKKYDQKGYQHYIYGSAEVVGLMCLRIFTEGDTVLFDKLKQPARKLGEAFQKINFLRDIGSDFHDRGRIYFPGIDFERFTEKDKQQLELDIASDFKDGLSGIVQLSGGVKKGVLLAYLYYMKLFSRIKKAKAEELLKKRIRVNNMVKVFLLIKVYFFASTY